MSRATRRRWILAGTLIVLATAATLGVSYRQALFARDPRLLSSEDLDLRIGKAEIADVQVAVSEVGTIEPIVKVDVKSTLSGTVREILVREGDRVRPGQTLARVEPDVNQAKTLSAVKSEVTVAAINLEKARRDMETNETLFHEGYVADTLMREVRQRHDTALERYNQAMREYRIVVDSGIPLDQSISTGRAVNVDSPMAGYVIKRGIEVGQTVMSGVSSFNEGTALFTVADLSSMLIKAAVNEVEIGRVRLGLPADITVDAFPYTHFLGTVSHISPAARLKEKVKVFDIEIGLQRQNPDFRAGMTANVEIRGESVEDALSVPVEAIFKKADGEVVYVLKKTFDEPAAGEKPPRRNAAGKIDVSDAWRRFFEERRVTAGLASLERVQVLDGLSEGEQVALEDPTKPRQIADE